MANCSQLPLKPWPNNRGGFGRRCCSSLTNCIRAAKDKYSMSVWSVSPAASCHVQPRTSASSHNRAREKVSDQSCQSHFKAASPSNNRGRKMSVSQGENRVKEKNPVRALLVQHQAVCLCLSAGTSSQWSTMSSTMKASSGSASTLGFTAQKGLWVHSYFWGSAKVWQVKRSRLIFICT